jgi:hypothetical protein
MGWLDVQHRRPVDCLQSVVFNPKPVARRDAGTMQADGVRPIGRAGAEHAGKRLAHVVLGMRGAVGGGASVIAAEAVTLNNIGEVYRGLGEPRRALEYYGQALPIRREVGDRAGKR